MKTIETTQLQGISGGICFTNCQQDAGERALYNDYFRPTVMKETAFSALALGGAAFSAGLALGATAPLAAAVAVPAALYVGYVEYMDNELWLRK